MPPPWLQPGVMGQQLQQPPAGLMGQQGPWMMGQPMSWMMGQKIVKAGGGIDGGCEGKMLSMRRSAAWYLRFWV